MSPDCSVTIHDNESFVVEPVLCVRGVAGAVCGESWHQGPLALQQWQVQVPEDINKVAHEEPVAEKDKNTEKWNKRVEEWNKLSEKEEEEEKEAEEEKRVLLDRIIGEKKEQKISGQDRHVTGAQQTV